MRSVDLNCDVGEGAGSDAALMAFVSSVNIACGAHSGDPKTMRVTIKAAASHGVAIGAHPGYADRAGFGREEIDMSVDDVTALVIDQIASLDSIARSEGEELRHVKPHGALYNQAAREPGIAYAVATAIATYDRSLRLVGLADSELIGAGKSAGLSVAHEAFADRAYEPDGSLTPRSEKDALITDPAVVAERVMRLVTEGQITARTGADIELRADTICIHGDSPGAVAMTKAIRSALDRAGIAVSSLGSSR